MPASPKLAWRWIVGTTAAAMLFLAALPSVGRADTLTICINPKGRIKGINVSCPGTSLTWQTVGPKGDTGPDGVTGPPGFPGAQGAAGAAGIAGPTGGQGAFGPNGDTGPAGPIGDAGPQGIQGNPGIQGKVGLPGGQGDKGINGGTEASISFVTGGSLGDLGRDENVALSGFNSLSNTILTLGPGNGSDNGSDSVAVPMNDPGTGYNLFVGTDNHPGTNPINGAPMSYVFFLCKNNFFSGTCNVACVIVDPDTTCQDLKAKTSDVNTYAQGDLMALFAYADFPTANLTDVKWSATYQHNAFTAP